MTTFIDYAWAQFSPAQLKSMGFSGAARYLSHDNSKNLSPPERDNLRAAGFDIFLVCESVANRAAQGFAAGAADGTFYNQIADTLGYPAACTLAYAVDFDGSPAQVQPYFDGIASAGGRLECPYGSDKIIDGVRYRALYGWQTAAWSGGRVSKRAGLFQNGFHSAYDSNSVLVADFGQWRAGAAPPSPGPSTIPAHVLEEGMFTVEPNGQPRNVPIPSWAKFVKPLSNGTNARCVILDGNDKELAVHEKDWYAANLAFTMAIPPGAQCFGATNFGPEQSGLPPAGLEVIFDIA